MFVNEKSQVKFELNHGSKKADDAIISEIQKEWEEGELKVILDGFRLQRSHAQYSYVIANKNYQICAYQDWFILYNESGDGKKVRTLHDLSEATSGELTLKSVEI